MVYWRLSTQEVYNARAQNKDKVHPSEQHYSTESALSFVSARMTVEEADSYRERHPTSDGRQLHSGTVRVGVRTERLEAFKRNAPLENRFVE